MKMRQLGQGHKGYQCQSSLYALPALRGEVAIEKHRKGETTAELKMEDVSQRDWHVTLVPKKHL